VVMCGEMAGEPINVPFLVGLGIRDLSMNAASIPVIKKMIRDMNAKNARRLSEKIFQFTTVQEIIRFIQQEYKDILPYRETED
jgi:phosphoenolpyruvate-protein phosphotransferase (PTS system enzyme I)